jgi:alkylhydroperoxidase family enzyme
MRKHELTPPNALIELRLPTALYRSLSNKKIRELLAVLTKEFKDVGELDRLHSDSYRNEEAIQCSELLGCFYCKKIWRREDKGIEDWIDCCEDDKELPQEKWTALCPWCGIDSVLADAKGGVNPATIDEMNRYWFGRKQPC